MRFLVIILTLITVNSCRSDIKAKFEITNMTEKVIDSINVKSYDDNLNPNYLMLESGESQIYWLDMTDLPKVDGDYLLTFKRKGKGLTSQRFGYFTNGYPLEKVTKIEIRKDTVIIDQILDKY